MGWFRSTPEPQDDVAPSLEDRVAQIGPGVPGHCPACDGLGYIENIDIGHRYQIQHCKECLHRWEYLFDADGKVIGLTELDDRREDVVVDVRDAVVAEPEVLDLREASQLSAGAWLRRSRRR